MQPTSILLSPLSAGVARMLTLAGHPCDEQQLLLGMEAPFLFVHDEGRYRTGTGLCRPKWLNLYAHHHGFHIQEHLCSPDDVPGLLRASGFALLPIASRPKEVQYMLFTGYAGGRYAFCSILPDAAAEPSVCTFTAPMLKRRLSAQVCLYTLAQSPVAVPDFTEPLRASLAVLDSYEAELAALRHKSFTLAEFRALHQSLFRALMMEALHMLAEGGHHRPAVCPRRDR